MEGVLFSQIWIFSTFILNNYHFRTANNILPNIYLYVILSFYLPLLREYYIKMVLWLYNLPHDAVKYKWKKLFRLS
ncbi:unnamed protein product [Rhizophagus irregularis]|nr:unnamed protein product [Rhizophagus irregularis]